MENCALIFTGGESPSTLEHISLPPCPFVCAADSGLEQALKLGFSVDVAIGDFDSIKDPSLLNEITLKRLPRDKDITDTEAALQLIRENNYDHYVLIGGGGRRFDHSLHLYSLFEKYGPPKLWLTAREQIYLVKKSFSKSFPHNTTLSIVPSFSSGQSKVTSQGLVWPLRDYPISMESQSISNRNSESKVSLRVEGEAVFIIERRPALH
ncbi:MAG: thiamine diphosphokinase [Spirochaetales bacterium]|jgi:thiamine pyrophosphokinase|nr:thiamine diphosphokinase [Spirochaetales bacterium]